MKNIGRLIILVVSVLSIGGCSRRASLLSDAELAQIFHDAFLANAYTSSESVNLDSLRLYEPIFQRYGYTVEDVQYSIGNFSMRKSARLSDVVERAISMLEVRGMELDREVAILDTVQNIAKRRAVETIYTDSMRMFRSREDSLDMIIVIEPIREGSYRLSFDYLVDSLDTSKMSYISRTWLEEDLEPKIGKEGDTTILEPRRYRQSNSPIKRGEVFNHRRDITVDEKTSRLVLSLISWDSKRDQERIEKQEEAYDEQHSVTVKRVKLVRMPKSEESMEVVYEELLGIKIFDDELLFETIDEVDEIDEVDDEQLQ